MNIQTDHLGNTFPSLAEMCKAYGLSTPAYISRKKRGWNLEKILTNPIQTATEICKKYNCITVLKSHETIVTDGKNIYKNTTETTALAKGGSGDVLAGIIASFVAQGMLLFDAATLGVYLHGKSGDLAAKNLTEYCVTALDTIRFLPLAFMDYAK